MLTLSLLVGVAFADPAYQAEAPTDLPVALRAWDDALRESGLSTRPTPETLLLDDHPLLPNTVQLNFSGLVEMGFRDGMVNGTLTVERVAPGQSRVSLEFTPGPTAREAKIQPKLLAKLTHSATSHYAEPSSSVAGLDPALLDPARCAARIGAFESSPFPGAEGVLIAHLDSLPASCRRPAIAALLPSPEGKAAVCEWLVRAYEVTPDADKPAMLQLSFQIADPPPEIDDLIDREEARQDAQR